MDDELRLQTCALNGLQLNNLSKLGTTTEPPASSTEPTKSDDWNTKVGLYFLSIHASDNALLLNLAKASFRASFLAFSSN